MACLERLRSELPSIDRTCYAHAVTDYVPGHCEESTTIIDDQSSVANSYRRLAQLAAGLRHAYLGELEFLVVRSLADETIQFEVQGGRHFQVSPYDAAAPPARRAVIVQAASAASWLDMSRWRQLAPYARQFGDNDVFPLSEPQHYAANFEETLITLGASQQPDGAWRPPRGSANDDVYSYLQWQLGERVADVSLSSSHAT